MAYDVDQGRAAKYLGQVNLAIIAAAAGRRQGHDDRPHAPGGARPPAALGQSRVALDVIEEAGADGRPEPITPLGYKTARRALPRVLSDLSEVDPRRRAANQLADTMERIGSVKGSDLAGTDSKGGISDGGATTRVKHAERLLIIEMLANRWPHRRRGRAMPAAERILMLVQRNGGKRQDIKAFPALIAVCVDGLALDDVLRRHGWSAQTANRKALAEALLAALDDVADGLGFGRWEKKKA
jgi:hypothetical protein